MSLGLLEYDTSTKRKRSKEKARPLRLPKQKHEPIWTHHGLVGKLKRTWSLFHMSYGRQTAIHSPCPSVPSSKSSSAPLAMRTDATWQTDPMVRSNAAQIKCMKFINHLVGPMNDDWYTIIQLTAKNWVSFLPKTSNNYHFDISSISWFWFWYGTKLPQ